MEFSETRVVASININTTRNYTEDDINTIMVGAIEGGINYWGYVTPQTKVGKPSHMATSDWCTKMLLEGKTVDIGDIEHRDDIWHLTLGKLRDGIQLNSDRISHDPSMWDADDYDRIFQYALFGEVVFG